MPDARLERTRKAYRRSVNDLIDSALRDIGTSKAYVGADVEKLRHMVENWRVPEDKAPVVK